MTSHAHDYPRTPVGVAWRDVAQEYLSNAADHSFDDLVTAAGVTDLDEFDVIFSTLYDGLQNRPSISIPAAPERAVITLLIGICIGRRLAADHPRPANPIPPDEGPAA